MKWLITQQVLLMNHLLDWDFQDENVETVKNFFTVRADRVCAFLLVEAIPSSGSHCFY